jgi:glycosyltransferase involved in cell wall biosynthesis
MEFRTSGRREVTTHDNPQIRSWPSVTAIVPSRGRPQLLERAVRSILAQRYDGELKCLVVLDGPESEPQAASLRPEFLATLNGRRDAVGVMRNSGTRGASGARNTGARAARSEFVAFCDDDDEWLPDKLRDQVAALLRSPASAATSGINVVYRGRTICRVSATERVTFSELLRSRRTDMHTSTLVVRRDDFLARIGPFDERIPGSYGEDYDWLLRAARLAPILTPQRPLATVYWHESSYFDGRWQTIVDALLYLLAKHPEFRRDRRGLARIYGQLAFASAALGRRADARVWVRRCLALDPRELRAYLAVLIAARVVRPHAMLRLVHHLGRGV